MIATADSTDVVIALIGAAAIVTAALVPTLAARRAREDITQRLGKPNGQGTVVEMHERSLVNQGQIAAQLDSVAAQQEQHSLLDTRRFKALYEHLKIPYDFEETPHG